jgi:transcription antitermination factor NusA-like protein
VKSGILCPKCEEKLQRGQITELDLEIIKILSDIEKAYPILHDVSFQKAVKAGNTLAILIDKRDVRRVLSYGGKIVKLISEKTGNRVKVLGYGGDVRQFLEELFNPLSILTINTIWLPDGSTETKVILHGRKPKRMPIDFEVVKRLAKEIRGLTLRIEFERT